jgi:exopolyphosphatase/pppGpp-phosphohydrolase
MLSVARVLSLLLLPGAVASTQVAPTPVCAIDMGSNSFRRIVASFVDGRYVEARMESRTLGVGEDVERGGRITDPKLAEIARTLADFQNACRTDGATGTAAVGTAAFRDATNGSRVIELAAQLGISMEIATEQRESELAYLVGSLGRDDVAVIDNGSRSIELVTRDGAGLRFVVFNLGYRLAYEQFFARATDPAAAIAAFSERLRLEAAGAGFMRGRRALVGVEFEEMAEVLFEPAPTEGRVLTRAVLRRRLDQIASSSADFALLKQQNNIDRALPRLVTAVVFAELFDYAQLELTSRQLGAGLIIESALNKQAR